MLTHCPQTLCLSSSEISYLLKEEKHFPSCIEEEMLLPSSVSFFIIISPRKTRNFFPLKIFIVWIRQSSFKIILLPTKSNILRTDVCSYSHVPIVVTSIFPLFYYYWNLRPSSKFTYSSLAPTYLNERPGWGSEANWVCGSAIGLLSQLGQITKPPPCLLICEQGLTIVSSISRVLRDLLMKALCKS